MKAGTYEYEMVETILPMDLTVDSLLEDLLINEKVRQILRDELPEIILHKEKDYEGKTLRDAVSFVYNIYALLDLNRVSDFQANKKNLSKKA